MVTVAFRVLKNRPLVIRSFHKKKEKQQSAAFLIKPEPFVTVGYRTKPLDEDTQSHIPVFRPTTGLQRPLTSVRVKVRGCVHDS